MEANLAPDRALVVPAPWSMVRHALPNVVEGKLVPLAIFLGFLELAGMTGAVLAALAWSLACIAWRLATGRKVPGLVVLSAIGLTAKTVLAVATGSTVAYFLQPTITTALVGTAFLVSVPLGRPLAERLALDFCPFEPGTAEHPHVRRFFVRLSLLWALTSITNACLTLWLLLTQPVATFVVVKSVLGPAAAFCAVGAALLWFHTTARRAGLSVVMARTAVPRAVRPPSV
ncbi:MAG TPA: VC0807 family protein [Acidimicrobiales bacterium]|nr:VC0807 family protein [Acidimicrobiales bacterium]